MLKYPIYSKSFDPISHSIEKKYFRSRREKEEKAALSGYILDEGRGNSFDQQEPPSEMRADSGEILPSAILDTNDELTNLYKTISRKKILSKVQSGVFSHHKPEPHRPQLTPNTRPLAKILNMLHSVNTNENMYTSIPEDSVYQSLPTQTSGEGRWSIIFIFLIDWLQMTTITRNRSREK